MAHQTSHFAVFVDERTRADDERTRGIDERTRLGCNRTRPLRLNPSGQDDAGSARFRLFYKMLLRLPRVAFEQRDDRLEPGWPIRPNDPRDRLTGSATSA